MKAAIFGSMPFCQGEISDTGSVCRNPVCRALSMKAWYDQRKKENCSCAGRRIDADPKDRTGRPAGGACYL